jgi:hypothetical protein
MAAETLENKTHKHHNKNYHFLDELKLPLCFRIRIATLLWREIKETCKNRCSACMPEKKQSWIQSTTNASNRIEEENVTLCRQDHDITQQQR